MSERKLVIWEAEEGEQRQRGQGLTFHNLHLTTDKPEYLLSPHWPMWSEALGFVRYSQEDSLGRDGWLHSPAADI